MKTHPFLFLAFLGLPIPGVALAQSTAPSPAYAAPPAVYAAPPTAYAAPPTGYAATTADYSPPTESVDRRVEMWRLEMGYRGSFVPSSGFDPFSTNDLLPQFSIAASRTLVARDHLSLAVGLGWDHGTSDATARGDQASLEIERLTVPIEGRLHFGRWGYAFLRGAPGVLSQHAELDDPSAPAPLSKTKWLFATDVSAGYAWLLWRQTREPARVARLWLQADAGYGWVARERLDLGPALASGDARVVSGIDLGSITTSGAFFRAAAAVSF